MLKGVYDARVVVHFANGNIIEQEHFFQCPRPCCRFPRPVQGPLCRPLTSLKHTENNRHHPLQAKTPSMSPQTQCLFSVLSPLLPGRRTHPCPNIPNHASPKTSLLHAKASPLFTLYMHAHTCHHSNCHYCYMLSHTRTQDPPAHKIHLIYPYQQRYTNSWQSREKKHKKNEISSPPDYLPQAFWHTPTPPSFTSEKRVEVIGAQKHFSPLHSQWEKGASSRRGGTRISWRKGD